MRTDVWEQAHVRRSPARWLADLVTARGRTVEGSDSDEDECLPSSFDMQRSGKSHSRTSSYDSNLDGQPLSRASTDRMSASTIATSVSGRSRASTSSGWSRSSGRGGKAEPTIESWTEDPSSMLRSLSAQSESSWHLTPLDKPAIPPLPLPEDQKRSRRLRQCSLEESIATDFRLSDRIPDAFIRFQPVTVAFDRKPVKGQSAPTEPKLKRAIIVEQIDAFSYSVRLVAKSYSHDASQWYRWHWSAGRRELAIEEGRRVHEDPKTDWTLVTPVPTERIAKASRRIKLPS